MYKKTITSEYVGYAHPDKIADAISDAILDEFLKQDSNAKTGIETLVKDNIVVLGGEVSSTATVNYEEVVRNVFKNLPFSKEHHLAPNEIKIINLIGKQSTEIHNGVDKGKGIIGAGDQGFMVGYASNETYTYMPLGHYLAKKICQYIASLTPLYGPDTKSQVTVEYDENNIPTVKHILISTMHQNSLDNCRNDITKYIINNKCYILPEFDLCIKMWDFDFACIPGYVNNIKVEEKWTRDINITTKQNRYYDIHYFFSTLQLFYPKIKDRSYVGDVTVDFINDIILSDKLCKLLVLLILSVIKITR